MHEQAKHKMGLKSFKILNTKMNSVTGNVHLLDNVHVLWMPNGTVEKWGWICSTNQAVECALPIVLNNTETKCTLNERLHGF